MRSLRDASELQDSKRFDNSYFTVFSKFSSAFQAFIVMLLHPDPTRRVPRSDVHLDCPVVKIFCRFPPLIGTVSIEEIIENVTPSPTQAALLQVTKSAYVVVSS